MNEYGGTFTPDDVTPDTEFAVIMYDEGTVTFYGTEKTYDEAGSQWEHHATVKPHQIIMIVQRTVTRTRWTTDTEPKVTEAECNPCTVAHPKDGCTDVGCTHNCEREVNGGLT